MFVNHILAKETQLPPMPPCLYEYVFASNGIFVRAKRPGLEALIWVAATSKPVRGLAEVKPYVKIYTRVRASIMARMFELAYRANEKEILFYLSFCISFWRLKVPEQIQGSVSVHPVDSYAGGSDTLIEVHSHHNMAAFFSRTDDRDESSGFRLFTVLGGLDRKPSILTRVGIYGHFQEIPSSLVYELPAGVNDALNEVMEDIL